MKILFLCVANSARSQMAEGLAKSVFGKKARVQSAGSSPAYVHPVAREVLSEIDIDVTGQYSKSVNDIDPDTVDTVITLCAEEVCPLWTEKAKRIHWPLPDPASPGSESDQRAKFREVRDELLRRIRALAAES